DRHSPNEVTGAIPERVRQARHLFPRQVPWVFCPSDKRPESGQSPQISATYAPRLCNLAGCHLVPRLHPALSQHLRQTAGQPPIDGLCDNRQSASASVKTGGVSGMQMSLGHSTPLTRPPAIFKHSAASVRLRPLRRCAYFACGVADKTWTD
ncbi:hypothetical protein BaRGS_00016911, partial [Batillaria attramentaria]